MLPDIRRQLKETYSKNREYYETAIRDYQSLDWSKPNLMAAAVCEDLIDDAIVAEAAGQHELFELLVEQGDRTLASALLCSDSERCENDIDLTRPRIAVARLVHQALKGNPDESSSSIPYGFFPGFLRSRDAVVEESSVAALLWALLAAFEGNLAQHEKARGARLPVHADLQEEVDLAWLMRDLIANQDDQRWREFEAVLARWLLPGRQLQSYVSGFAQSIRSMLVLTWNKFYLHDLSSEAVLATFFGETLEWPADLAAEQEPAGVSSVFRRLWSRLRGKSLARE